MKQTITAIVLLLMLPVAIYAQELFVFTEPASNMPAKSIGVRLNNWFMQPPGSNNLNYQFVPEVMWGVNKRLMLHVEGFLGGGSENFKPEGLGLYAKYRFYSNDQVYHHFRMAAFVRGTTNSSPVNQEELQTFGYNTGGQLGLIGTQLMHKTALSSTVYYEQAFNNLQGHEFPATFSDKAMNYTFSAGRLLLPKKYTGFKQTNLNFMVECLGQTLLKNGKSFLDLAPAIQFIFNSQARLDIGYKKEVYSNMQRYAPNGFTVRLEYLFFNAL